MNGLILAIALTGQVQLMEADQLAMIRGSLPDLAVPEWHDRLHDSRVMWYTEKEIPPAFQKAVANGLVRTSFHSPFYNMSADPSDAGLPRYGRRSGGNANGEFPWILAPGGAHRARSVNSFKGLLLPEGKPVVWFVHELPGRVGDDFVIGPGIPDGPSSKMNQVYDWTFPKGTVFIEVLTMRIRDEDVVFEVRFREREIDEWGVELFRPFVSATQLADALGQLGSEDSLVVEAIAALRAPEEQAQQRLADVRHTRKMAFDETEYISPLPKIATDDVLQLIDREWQSALGETWKQDALAPTNTTKFINIFPPNYDGVFVGNDRNRCMKCHDSTNSHATEFEHPRGWYGRVRGNTGGIFSWHPIDPETIASRGGVVTPKLRREFVGAGIVEAHDASRHSEDDYRLLKGDL